MPAASGLRRRKRPAANGDSAVQTSVSGRSAGAASPDVHNEDPPPLSADEEIASANASFLSYVGICLAVTVFYVGLAFSTPRIAPGTVRAVVIDAGSTGTRAQIFSFATEPHFNLRATEFYQIPASVAALGAYPSTVSGAAFFEPLLDRVKKRIPSPRRQAITPIVLRATAGLRLLGNEGAEHALRECRRALRQSGFLFQDEWASVLDEKDEGIYAWTTVNYLLGNLDVQHITGVHPADKPFAGVLDLGGGSLQLVFRSDDTPDPPRKLSQSQIHAGTPQSLPPAVMRAEFMGKQYRVLAKSHLGHGLFDFTKKLYLLFDREGVLEHGNPCFRKGKKLTRKSLRLGVPGAEETRVVDIDGDGDFQRCVASCEIILDGFDVPSSSAVKLAKNTEFYAFAYFFDRTVGLGLPENATKAQLEEKGRELCGPEKPASHREHKENGLKLEDFDEACAEFSYIYALLKRLSHDFDVHTGVSFRFVQHIDGHMLGWALGAVLAEVREALALQLLEKAP